MDIHNMSFALLRFDYNIRSDRQFNKVYVIKIGRAPLEALPIQPPYQRIIFLPWLSKLCRLSCPQILQEAPAMHLLMK